MFLHKKKPQQQNKLSPGAALQRADSTAAWEPGVCGPGATECKSCCSVLSPATLLRGALTAVRGAGRKGPPQGVRQQPFPTALQWLRAALARAGREHEVVGAEGFAGMDGFAACPPAFCPNESDMSLSGERRLELHPQAQRCAQGPLAAFG